MKSFFSSFIVAIAAFFFFGCDDSSKLKLDITNLQDRVSVLEQVCTQFNSSLTGVITLVNALNNNDFITSVTPVYKEKEIIGYTISFLKASPIIIYNGVNGKDGITPNLGLRQDTDGIWYWTLGNDWLLDSNNQRVRATGAQGETGATPQLKIQEGYWYLSIDGGNTWTQLGQATGKDGDSFFQSVDYSNEDWVVFTLTNGASFVVPQYKGYGDYEFVKAIENASVEGRLVQFSRGTSQDALYYNPDYCYDRLNIAFMTDSHLDLGDKKASVMNVIDAIDFCNKVKVPIAAIIQGGDLITSIQSNKERHIAELQKYFDMGWQANMPLLYTKGNHDLNTIRVSPDKALSDKDWGEVWYNRAETEYHIVRNTKSNGEKSGYYYYDLNDWKIRIISLDCFDVDVSKTDENGDILYWGGTSFYIADEQFNWVVNIALNFDDKSEKDWGVIVFTHLYRPSDTNGSMVSPVFDSIYPKLNRMFHAFNSQSTFTEEYVFPENHFYDLSVKADWTRYSNQSEKPYLICVLSGHVHTDAYYQLNGINQIITANQFCGDTASDLRINRVAGTRTQNLFDIINLDLVQRRIRIIRYGAGANCYGEGGDRFLPDGISF